MILTRRRALVGGGVLAALLLRPSLAMAGDPIEIATQGAPDGSRVWFDPLGLRIEPGQTVRWTNRDAGNSHTVTSYHPELFNRPQRIPAGAAPFGSDYLLPGDTFSVTFSENGIYDYYCVPHEHAGMVGRIVVGSVPSGEPYPLEPAAGLVPIPEIALENFPSVADILAKGKVHHP